MILEKCVMYLHFLTFCHTKIALAPFPVEVKDLYIQQYNGCINAMATDDMATQSTGASATTVLT